MRTTIEFEPDWPSFAAVLVNRYGKPAKREHLPAPVYVQRTRDFGMGRFVYNRSIPYDEDIEREAHECQVYIMWWHEEASL